MVEDEIRNIENTRDVIETIEELIIFMIFIDPVLLHICFGAIV